MNTLNDFVQKWCHPDHPPTTVDADDLLAAEHKLGVVFPEDYRSSVLAVGLPSPTLALLSAIVDKELDLRDLANLLSPEEVVDETFGWREIGMPGNLIAIGNDAGGSKFCFDEDDLKGQSVASAPIYFWDHDFDETERVSDSFSAWIGSYLGDWSRGLNFKDF